MRWQTYCNPTTLAILFVVLTVAIGSRMWQPDSDPLESNLPASEWKDPTANLSPDVQKKAEAIRASTEAKRVVAWELATGRVTLLDAAALIRAIDRGSPHFDWEGFRRQHEAPTDEERHCREAIGWVPTVWPDRDETDERVRTLEAELECHLRKGPLRLPD